MKYKPESAMLKNLSPGDRVSGVSDYPMSIYRIVHKQPGKSVFMGICDLEGPYHNDDWTFLINEKSGRIRLVPSDTEVTILSPAAIYRNIRNKRDNKTNEKEQNTMTNEKRNERFNFDKTAIKGNLLTAASDGKDAVLKMKAGKAVIAAIKSSLKEIPGLPAEVLAALDTPYADALIGFSLYSGLSLITTNKTALAAASAANFAGAIQLSEKLTIVEDLIEKGIAFLPAKVRQAVENLEYAAGAEHEEPEDKHGRDTDTHVK